jgi:uncharacterized protein YjiS (DUF1127 family)
MPCANSASTPLIKIAAPAPVWVDWPWPDWIYAMLRRIGRMIDRHRQRRMLVELSDHRLTDIGVTREQAVREAAKPFWE